jgi:hypothetical protein
MKQLHEFSVTDHCLIVASCQRKGFTYITASFPLISSPVSGFFNGFSAKCKSIACKLSPTHS